MFFVKLSTKLTIIFLVLKIFLPGRHGGAARPTLLGRRRPAVFLPGGHAAPNMPLRLIDVQHLFHLDIESMAHFIQALG